MKTCSKCGQTLPLYSFYRGARDKLRAQCKACISARSSLPSVKAYKKRWYSRHTEKISEKNATRYRRLRGKILCSVKEWRKKNREKSNAIKANYKHRKRSQGAGVKASVLIAERAKRGGICDYCGERSDRALEVEHRVALSKGGKHQLSNIAFACWLCNRRKGAKPLKQFLKELQTGSIK